MSFFACDNGVDNGVKVVNGKRITQSDISSLDLSAISGEYLLQLTGTWDSSSTELSELGDKIKQANTNAKIILDMSELTNLTEIGDKAFEHCTDLMSVNIPSSVTSIGNWVFAYCTDLMSVNIPSGVTTIGEYVFYGCKVLTSVTIPSSVMSIGDYTFGGGCTNLTSFTVDKANTNYKASDDGKMLLSKDGKTLVCYPSATGNVTNIPDGVTSIGSAFAYCTGLTSVNIPDSVNSIDGWAFDSCTDLTSVNIGSGVTSIGILAFQNCTSLTSVTIPSGVTSIGNWVFASCENLASITFATTTGWRYTDNKTNWQNKTGGTSCDVSNSATNAAHFTRASGEPNYNYYWYKN